jgi:hypothetical protein
MTSTVGVYGCVRRVCVHRLDVLFGTFLRCVSKKSYACQKLMSGGGGVYPPICKPIHAADARLFLPPLILLPMPLFRVCLSLAHIE